MLADELGERLARWELCAFNRLCESKYRRLGLTWPYAGAGPTAPGRARDIRSLVLEQGLAPKRVRVTGLGGEDA